MVTEVLVVTVLTAVTVVVAVMRVVVVMVAVMRVVMVMGMMVVMMMDVDCHDAEEEYDDVGHYRVTGRTSYGCVAPLLYVVPKFKRGPP